MASSFRLGKLTIKNVEMKFLVGTFQAALRKIVSLQKKDGSSSSQVILPCTLNDLAMIAEFPLIAKEYGLVDYCTTDGVPLTWWFRHKTRKSVERAYGPDIMSGLICSEHFDRQLLICPDKVVCELLKKKLYTNDNQRNVMFSVIGDANDSHERKKIALQINKFKPSAVWIGVGSPNQVMLATYLKRVVTCSVTYFCVGAALPFFAGTKPQAPRWMQQHGFEWLFRLVTEPKRLWRRYLVIMPLFLLRQLFDTIWQHLRDLKLVGNYEK